MHFQNLYETLNICQKKMTLKADVFPEIPAPKGMVREMVKKQCFRGPLDREHGKLLETMFKSEWQYFNKICQYCEGSGIGKSLF